MISIVCNVDSRKGAGAEQSTVGDFGPGSLQGVRSYDLLTDGIRNKIQFFAGHTVEVIVACDEHEPLPDSVQSEIHEMIRRGEIDTFICQPHERKSKFWYDKITVAALKLATGSYVAHFDQDCAAFRDPNSDIVSQYLRWLDDGYQFVCQPTTMTLAEHKMYWASTRFFICKRETLDFVKLDEAVVNEDKRFAKYGHAPALEHVLGRLGGVLYPPANWDDYMVISWQTYRRGVLKSLNSMPYPMVRDFILKQGICGPNDVACLELPTV
jgi:hypothetical protein